VDDVVENAVGRSATIGVGLLDAPIRRDRYLRVPTEVAMPNPRNRRDGRLTPREREVLQQAALGMSNRQIGDELDIAEQTVKNHLSSAMRKLSIRDRTSAVVLAFGQGLISIPVAPESRAMPETDLVRKPSSDLRGGGRRPSG
jgi:DNA-binding NarL/FixJ family response regulator